MDWIEIGKTFGFPSLCLAVLAIGIWRACRWFALQIAEPVAEDLRAAIRAGGPAAVQLRDDVAEIKQATIRIEKRQDEHFEICAGVGPRKMATA